MSLPITASISSTNSIHSCPTECRLSRSTEGWKCKVSLHVFENGKVRNEPFGDVITDKSLVEERIRRAQRAILNPKIRKDKGLKYYLNDDDETMELSFSTDCVSLQISGPDVADLSFCDLPGTFTVVIPSLVLKTNGNVHKRRVDSGCRYDRKRQRYRTREELGFFLHQKAKHHHSLDRCLREYDVLSFV